MAITAYTGPPGAGKSYALVEQIIVPGVQAGRRVLTNIDGLDPDAVWRYCAERADDPSKLGRVELFDGRRSTEPGFFPTEQIADTDTVVKGGDLIVFDEWRLYWPRRSAIPSPDLEPFLRWHRHLSNDKGHTCDVAIGTQLMTDLHQDFRGLCERSYKFKKLKAVGLSKAFAWDAFEGHLQAKGGAYLSGNGTYKAEIYALYSSYGGGKGATELVTDKRTSIVGRGTAIAAGLGVVVVCIAMWYLYGYFFPGAEAVADETTLRDGSNNLAQAPRPVDPVPSKGFRIVGHIEGDTGTRVIVLDGNGALRVLAPSGFSFDEGRPVSGTVDGRRVVAEDRVSIVTAPVAMPLAGGL